MLVADARCSSVVESITLTLPASAIVGQRLLCTSRAGRAWTVVASARLPTDRPNSRRSANNYVRHKRKATNTTTARAANKMSATIRSDISAIIIRLSTWGLDGYPTSSTIIWLPKPLRSQVIKGPPGLPWPNSPDGEQERATYCPSPRCVYPATVSAARPWPAESPAGRGPRRRR